MNNLVLIDRGVRPCHKSHDKYDLAAWPDLTFAEQSYHGTVHYWYYRKDGVVGEQLKKMTDTKDPMMQRIAIDVIMGYIEPGASYAKGSYVIWYVDGAMAYIEPIAEASDELIRARGAVMKAAVTSVVGKIWRPIDV